MFKIRPWRLLMFTEIKTMRTVLWLFTAAALWFLADGAAGRTVSGAASAVSFYGGRFLLSEGVR